MWTYEFYRTLAQSETIFCSEASIIGTTLNDISVSPNLRGCSYTFENKDLQRITMTLGLFYLALLNTGISGLFR
jgi:hypothetical protein